VKDELMALVEAAGRPETNKLYRTVCRWWTEIEVLIVTGATTGKVEANNTGIKHIKRTARIPEPRQLQISYSHDQCRRDSGMTLIRESLPMNHEASLTLVKPFFGSGRQSVWAHVTVQYEPMESKDIHLATRKILQIL
jgi:hypothetical protein